MSPAEEATPLSFEPAFRRSLLDWFDAEFRELPWRQTRDPYKIWVSEVMLQQTQVKTVIPYYQRFVAALPVVASLAAADLSQVLKLWEGLGYYARARNMKKAAEQIVREHSGVFPKSMKEIERLPGIGEYTAAAVASIAFGTAVPAIDGNVSRVLARLFFIHENPKTPSGHRTIKGLAERLLDRERPGDFNQAMMELGAVICTPRRPQCPLCPVKSFCDAFVRGMQEHVPVKNAKKEQPHVNIAVGLVWNGNRLLIDRRHEKGLLGGLWEFPGGKIEEGETPEQAVVREVREELGVETEVLGHFMSLDHAYTHFSITLHAFHCRYLGGEPQALDCAEWRWATKEELPKLAFPRANAKLIAKLLESSDR